MEVIVTETKPQQSSAAAPAAQPPPETPLTPEQVRTQVRSVYASMGWGDAPADLVGSESAPATAPETKPAEAAPTAQAQPETEPQSETEPETVPLTQEQVISKTASETAKAFAQQMMPTAPAVHQEVEKSPPFEMSPEDEEDYRVLLYLESTGDPRFKGLAQVYLDYVKKHYAYQDEWCKNNPGKEFNGDDEEHSEWYAANVPEIDPKILEDGKVDMRVESKVQEIVTPKLEKIDLKDAYDKRIPTIAENVDKGIGLLLKRSAPDLAKLAMTSDGSILFTAENIAKIDEADPIAKEIIDDITKREVEPRLLELQLSSFEDLKYNLDPAKNPIHADIYRFLRSAEREMTSAPAPAQLKDGRQFITRAKYDSEMEKIQKSSTDQEQKKEAIADFLSKYWTFSVNELQDMIVDFWAIQARKRIEKADAIAKRKYGSNGQPSNNPTPKPATAPEVKPSENHDSTTTRRNPPSLESSSDRVALPTGVTVPPKSFPEQAVDFHFR